MTTATAARRWHLVTGVVAVTALVLQLVLVVQGGGVLDERSEPGLAVRLGRLVSYFTIQSNLLVAVAAITLARYPSYDGRWWRALRLAGLVGITVTGLVHFVLLRPLLDLTGWDWAADKLLHMVVPALVVVGWLAFGPRPRVTLTEVRRALIWPLLWLAWTLAVGALTGWYPYPFLDVDAEGWPRVLAAAAMVTVLFLALFAAAYRIDRHSRPAPSWD
ncbi:Pr6Pr family membrane protein [Nocardioides sp. W7]|uniref:Pr6Pr family membrane protein n=1 Tax=Nocardioides sp. W7 TaxID=2931390 RepID=UPI001FD298C6|nr:Pr6Pr family membrane protein [Nocardioides sp. W7]